MARQRFRQRGGALLLLTLMVLLIAGITVAVMMLDQVQQAARPEARTATVQADLEKTIARFVVANRRLPCGADGRIATGAPNAGVESRDVSGDCTAVNFGIVPWVTLQITEAEAIDGWGSRLTYRVPTGATGFTRNLAFDMSSCAAAGTAGTTATGGASSAVVCQARPFPCAIAAACTSIANYVINRGIRVNDGAGAAIMNPAAGTGAAYVVISAGANLAGAYGNGGIIRNAQGVAAGTGETTNRNNNALQAAYVDAARDNSTTATHFDDIVLRPAIATVLGQAQLGARP